MPYLEELYGHQQWADAEHWRAFSEMPAALDDKAIKDRLFHIHYVQHAFAWIVGPRSSQFSQKKVEDFPDASALKGYAQEGLAELDRILRTTTPDQMEQIIVIPWFNPPAKISRRQALTQAAMHSHYHRGQNATRFRELGGVPPMTDFIVWIKNGQPAAQWS